MIGCRALTDPEVTKLLSKLSYRDATLFTLGLKTGFRITELLSIKINDLYEHTGALKTSLVVSRASMKGKLSSRAVPLSKDTLELLKVYVDTVSSQTYLFQSQKGSKLSRIQAWRSIHNAAKDAGLTGKIATHSARKTVAKKAYEASGKDLVLTQKIMGHKNVSSTISYLNVDVESLKNIWEKVQS